MTRMPGTQVAYMLDPRFPGGTSSAVAAELLAVAPLVRPVVHAVSSRMFSGTEIAPQLAPVFDALEVTPIWDAPAIAAGTVILHNPAFLKYDGALGRRIVARHLIMVMHENFLRPGGEEGFDVGAVLDRIDRGSVALRKSIAPISAHNRATITDWVARHGMPEGWAILPEDWFNICDFAMAPPTASPRDRRGRHSRPGFEKFPPPRVLEQCFPRHAEANVVLGADLLLAVGDPPAHWQLYPFRALELAQYFEMIDFMVYFTAPTWQESFGRVLAEGIAAGKVVIADAATASGFGGAVIAARPDEVDGIIASLVADPARYQAQVRRAQAAIGQFSAEAFRARFSSLVELAAEPAP